MSLPHKYDVWKLPFAFEDNPSVTKDRPVVVGHVMQHENTVLVLVIKVTSHSVRPNVPGEVELLDWAQAGLDKPSVARCSKQLLVDKSAFKNQVKFGSLSTGDAKAVNTALIKLGTLMPNFTPNEKN